MLPLYIGSRSRSRSGSGSGSDPGSMTKYPFIETRRCKVSQKYTQLDSMDNFMGEVIN